MTDLVEQTRKYLDEERDDELEPLNEIISLRIGAIAGFLAKTKQYANKIDGEVRRLVADAGKLKRIDTPEDTNKSLADALETIASLFYLQRKMMMYQSLVSASTGVGVDKGKKYYRKWRNNENEIFTYLSCKD